VSLKDGWDWWDWRQKIMAEKRSNKKVGDGLKMVSKRGSKIAIKIDTEKVKCLAFCWLKFCQKTAKKC